LESALPPAVLCIQWLREGLIAFFVGGSADSPYHDALHHRSRLTNENPSRNNRCRVPVPIDRVRRLDIAGRPEIPQEESRALCAGREGTGADHRCLWQQPRSRRGLAAGAGGRRQGSRVAPVYVRWRAQSARWASFSGKFDPAPLAKKPKFLQKALALEPGYDYAMALVATNPMAEGKLAEADAVWRVVAMKSGYSILNAQIAHLAIERKEYAKAIEIASKGYRQTSRTRRWRLATARN
jgi:hypothetical protein